MAKLALRHCTPIKKGTKPISASIARSLIKQLDAGWSFNGDARGLEQQFNFKNFHETMSFVNAVAWIANTEDHHPDFEICYNRCKIKLTTHVAGGLTVNDFICAAKIDALYKASPEGTTTATAEKTRAMVPDPRARTGEVPRPVARTPELNMSEAEELLNVAIRPDPEPATDNDEYELKLTDPDDEPTLPHLQNPLAASDPAASKPAAEAPPDKPREPAAAPDGDNHAAGRFLNTVILPPGMQSIRHDKDEEATIIAQPDFGDENIELSTPVDADEVRTMIVQGLPEENADTEEKEDPDMMKTMIIRPPLLDDDDVLNAAGDGDETLLINPKPTGQNRLK